MDVVRLYRLRGALQQIKQAQSMSAVPAFVLPVTAQNRRKKKITPETIEAIKSLQETPTDVWSQQTGPGAALRATGIGAAVGSSLGFLGHGVRGKQKAPSVFASEKKLTDLAKELAKKPELKKEMEGLKRLRTVRRLAATGAALGAGSSGYYWLKRKGLKKKIEKDLGLDQKPKPTKTAAFIIGGVEIPAQGED